MRRVLLIIPNLDFGGAQKSFWRLSLVLAPHAEVKLVVFNRTGLSTHEHGGTLVDLDVPASSTWIAKGINFVRRIRRLRRIKEEFKPDVAISFLEGADYVNALSRRGETIYFYVHGSKIYDRNIQGVLGWLRLRALIPWLYQRASAILVVNPRLEDEFRATFRLKRVTFIVMPNFYDFDLLQRQSKEEVSELAPGFFATPTIAIMGRLAHEKGVDRFVEVLPSLRERHPNVKLLLIGDGPQEAVIRQKLATLGIAFADIGQAETPNNTMVWFAGYQANPYRFLGRCTLVALPSLNEGMPNTLVEALGLGVAIVAADCPYGPAELLSPDRRPPVRWPEIAEHGLLLPVMDSADARQQWLEALDMLLKRNDLREKLTVAGKRYVKRFSSSDTWDDWKKLLNL